jgi:hypothetical protein
MNTAKDINGFKDKVRKGRAIITYTGITFWPMDPRQEEIDIIDIAHSLSMQCRFNGHLDRFYSVAEHCVRVAAECSKKNRLWGLIHDSAEAYVSDLPAPIKMELQEYIDMENVVLKCICGKFGLPLKEPEEVKKYDLIIRATEIRDLMKNNNIKFNTKPLKTKIEPWTQKQAEKMFLEVFHALVKNAA